MKRSNIMKMGRNMSIVGGGGSGGSISGRPISAMLNITMNTIDLTPKNVIIYKNINKCQLPS